MLHPKAFCAAREWSNTNRLD